MTKKKFMSRSALFLLFAFLVLLQTGSRLSEPELRAEDGPVFFQGAASDPWASLFLEHNGYHHLGCRLAASLTSLAPCKDQPTVYLAAAIFALLALAWFSVGPSESFHLGWAAPFILVLVPQDGSVIAHLTDLPSLAALFLVLMILYPARKNAWGSATRLGAFFLAAMTGPYIVFFLPLILGFALWHRQKLDFLLLGLALVASYFQARHLPDARFVGDPITEVSPYLQAIGARSLAALWPYYRGGPQHFLSGLGLLFLAIVLFMSLVALRARAWQVLALLSCSLLALAATLWAYRGSPEVLLENPRDRYSFVHQVLFFWALLSLLRERKGEIAEHLRFGFLLVISLSACGNYVERPAFIHIGGWQKSCEILRSGLPVVVPIEPSWALNREPETKGQNWQDESLRRVFGPGVQYLGTHDARLSQLRGHEAIILGTDAVLILPARALPEGTEVLVSALSLSGLAQRSDELRFVVEELTKGGAREEIGAISFRPGQDYEKAEDWRFRIRRKNPEAELILRCETSPKGAWLQLWARGNP